MVKTVAQIAVALAPLFLAGTRPFVRVFHGSAIRPEFGRCWGMPIVWVLLFDISAPLVGSLIDPELGRGITHWVPDSPVVLAIIVFGWFYAGLTVALVLVARRAVDHWPWRHRTAAGVRTE